MPYFRHNFRSKKRFTRKNVRKDIASAKPSAWNQKRQLSKLASQVSRIHRSVREKTRYAQYQSYTSSSINEYHIWPVIDPNSWTRCFQDAPMIENLNRIKLRNVSLDMRVFTDSEPSPMTCTQFVVKLRPACARQVMAETSNMTTLTDGVHYISNSNALIMINKAMFKICAKPRRFQIGNKTFGDDNVADVTNLNDTQKRFYYKVPHFCSIRTGGDHTWVQMDKTDIPNYAHLFVLTFVSDTASDIQTCEIVANALINVST